jgi:ABC-type amino acid transport substrate-binding protein
MNISKRSWVLVLMVMVGLLMASSSHLIGQAFQPVLEKVKETGVLAVGMREAARPFAYIDERGVHVGFSVDMAYLLAEKLEEYAGREIEVKPVTVTPATRIPVVVAGTVDVEMGSTTHTAPRNMVVDFSQVFFISETTFMVRKDEGIKTLKDLDGKIVSSARGTTNLKALERIIAEGVIKPKDLVIVDTHAKGFLALEMKKIDAYFTDTSLLMGLKMAAKDPDAYEIILEPIHSEPYGWMVRENDSDWLDFVNFFLIWTLQTKCEEALEDLKDAGIMEECKDPGFSIFDAIYDKWMGPEAEVPIPRTDEYNALLAGIQVPGVTEVWPKE